MLTGSYSGPSSQSSFHQPVFTEIQFMPFVVPVLSFSLNIFFLPIYSPKVIFKSALSSQSSLCIFSSHDKGCTPVLQRCTLSSSLLIKATRIVLYLGLVLVLWRLSSICFVQIKTKTSLPLLEYLMRHIFDSHVTSFLLTVDLCIPIFRSFLVEELQKLSLVPTLLLHPPSICLGCL